MTTAPLIDDHVGRVAITDRDAPASPPEGEHTTVPLQTLTVPTSVRQVPQTTPAQRWDFLTGARHNQFRLATAAVTIDLLSDSGTGVTSAEQEAAALVADTGYAGRSGWRDLEQVVQDLTGCRHVLPVHQGRAAERVLFGALLGPGPNGLVSVSNTHFDTTAFNVSRTAIPINLPCAEAADRRSDYPFKGNIDLDRLQTALVNGIDGARVGVVLMTLTNNGGGGQPVSMANLQQASTLCRASGVPLIMDAARFAENAWLVIQREPGYADRTPRDVAAEAFACCDGFVMSLKKDGLVPQGGLIGLRADEALYNRCAVEVVASEGHTTYGGMSPGDLARAAVGLREVLEPSYLRSRADLTARLGAMLADAGVEFVRPAGMHALYVDAQSVLPHLPQAQFPGHALACQLYLAAGIRSSELGTLYLGTVAPDGPTYKVVAPAPFEQVRLAFPRRLYSPDQLEHVIDTIVATARDPEQVRGYELLDDPPMRPFSARLRPNAHV